MNANKHQTGGVMTGEGASWAMIYKLDETRVAKVQHTNGTGEFTELWSVRVPKLVGKLAARVFYDG